MDTTILKWFNHLAGYRPGFDRAVAGFTNYAPLVFLLLFAGYFLFTRTETERMRRTVVLAGLSGVIALAVSVIISTVFYRARPFVAIPDQVRLLVAHANDSSFPSDHAAGSAAFAAGMWRSPDRTAAWIFTVLALLVGLSRLVAAVHWPSDILASFVLGWLAAGLVFALGRPLSPVLNRGLHAFESLEQRMRGQKH